MKRLKEAVKLFKQRYGKTPKEAGFPVIDIYEKQSAFLYAVSEDVIAAYKLQQDILRWMIKWYVWPLMVAFLVGFVALIKFRDPLNPLCILTYIFYGIWLVLFAWLFIKFRPTKPLVKLGKTVTFLNYRT